MNQPKPEHRALCPVCGRLADQETTWTNDAGITEAAYLCGGPDKHSWTTKWYEPKGAAA